MYATVKLNNEMVWSCMECGCLVADKVRHDMWHVNTPSAACSPQRIRPHAAMTVTGEAAR